MKSLLPWVALILAFRLLMWFGSIVGVLVEYMKQLQF